MGTLPAPDEYLDSGAHTSATAEAGLDPGIFLSQRPVQPYVSPFAGMAEARANHEDSILRQQQMAFNRQQLGRAPPSSRLESAGCPR